MELPFTGIYLAVLVSSLTGSLHCVGMCGGLMMNSVKSPEEGVHYHLGRLLSYLSLGAIAGWIGNTLFTSSWLRSFQLLTSVSMGLLFCWMAFRTWNGKTFHFSLLPNSLLIRFRNWGLSRSGLSPALFVGISSGLLPCGWLHTFVVAALATQSPTQGSLLLLFFWLGSLPALAAYQATFQKITRPISRYSSKALAALLLIAGLSTLTFKSYALIFHSEDESSDHCPMHAAE